MASKSLTFDIYGRDKTASKTLDGIGGSANKMGATFAKVGKVIAAAAAVAVVAWAKSSIDSLARIESINAQTTAVLKSTGNAAKVSATHIEDLATALEKKTATEGESIQEGANLLLTFKNIRNEVGLGNDIFDQTTSVMVDMARAMGTDVSSGAVQLGKALNDPIAGISALSRVGITFTDDQKKVIESLVESGDTMGAQKVILQELQDQFGGSGAAFAETFAGKVDLIGHAWGEVGEAVFTKAMPALSDLADWVLSDGIPALDSFFDGIEKNKDILGPAAIAVGTLTAAMWLLNAAMAANPVGLVTAGLIAVISMTAGVTVAFNGIWEWMAEHPWSVVLAPLGLGGVVGTVTFLVNMLIKKGPELQAALAIMSGAFTQFVADIALNITKAAVWIGGLPARVALAAAGSIVAMRNLGVNMVAGMIEGMAAKVGDAVRMVTSIAGRIVRGAKSALGINSPSRVFRDEVGKWIPAGIVAGIADGKSSVDAAINGLVETPEVSRRSVSITAAPAASSAVPGMGASGASQVTNYNTFNAPAIETQDPLAYATVMGREFGRQMAG